MSICDELEELIPAYVLGALDPSERVRLEKHLRECPDLPAQIESYREVAAQLPYAADPAPPPPDLKYRVLAAVMPRPKFARPNIFGFVRAPAFAAFALVIAIGLGLWNIAVQNELVEQIAQDQKLLAQLARERDLVSVMAYGQGQPRELKGTEIAARSSGRLYGKADQSTFVLAVHNLPRLEPGKVYQVWLVSLTGERASGGTFTLDES